MGRVNTTLITDVCLPYYKIQEHMIRYYLFITLGICLVFVSCQVMRQKPYYALEAEITGAPEGGTVYLSNAKRIVIDSTIVRQHKFRFTGKVDYPTIYTITFVDHAEPNPNLRPIIPVFMENSQIRIRADIGQLSKESQFRIGQYDYDKVQVMGSHHDVIYREFLAGYKPLFESRKAAFRKYLDLINYGDPSNNVQKGITMVGQVDEAAAQRNDYLLKYIVDNPKSYVSLYIAGQYADYFDVDQMMKLLHSMDTQLLRQSGGKQLVSKIEQFRTSAVGAMYTDLSFQDKDGNPVRLSDHVAKGKYVLLEFWASWCVPCRADIPHLKENYKRYHPEGFEVISISMDAKKTDWLRALEEEKMPWLQVSDLLGFKGQVSKKYNFSGIPTCILIDPTGKIASRNMRGSWMDKVLIETYGDKFSLGGH
ncbi:Thiol-disulfide isomerase or thioredoxin [Sphingobacterium nematocida]|uniref:Thiol-disulfide isomerase or thioredoxin n=2 Tax=Sphingobacterium nematocida TaxID=1513896 RepID=A0A1T5AUH8_9SPHI|nr:Thiol-disulfide isomerase or thioredoxin [Sphingobacterium nematocida]